LTVHRIVQEALTNALKHAGTDARVPVEILREDPRLIIRVRDSGGAGVPAPANEEGHGLVGMQDPRAALYGRTASAGPAAGGGWRAAAPGLTGLR
jgi:signal transduction histidine kinase